MNTHEQIEIMANNGPLCKKIENIRIVGETVNEKWCVSKVPQYTKKYEAHLRSYLKLISYLFH